MKPRSIRSSLRGISFRELKDASIAYKRFREEQEFILKPEYYPSVIVACVGLLTAGWVFPQTWFGVASGVVLVFTCILAYIVKPKVERVFDGSNIDEIAALAAKKVMGTPLSGVTIQK